MGRAKSKQFELFKERYYELIKSGELNKNQVAEILGVTPRAIYKWCEELESAGEPFDIVLMKTKKEEETEETEEDEEIEENDEEEEVEETKNVKSKKEAPKSILDEAREIKKKMRKAGITKMTTKTAHKEEKDINYNFPRKATFEALDRSYAVMIRAYAERQEWLSKVIEDLGMTALMMALQLAKIPPSEWYDKISEFKNPKAFIDFVNEYIVALFEAKEDASKILELRDENNMLAARVYYLEAQVETLTRKLRELYNYLNAATSLLTKEQLQRLILWNAIYQMQNAEVTKIERGYEINGDEEANGRERFE